MKRIHLIYDVPGWAYHRRCQALVKYTPDDFDVTMSDWHPTEPVHSIRLGEQYDLILCLPPRGAELRTSLTERAQQNTVVVGGLNVGWGHHKARLLLNAHSDHIIVNNRDLWERLDRVSGTTWISNGVDLETFRVTRPLKERTLKVLWIGSHFHCKHTNIKGWDEVLVPLQGMLDAAGISHDFRRTGIDPGEKQYTTDEMVEWYNTGTIYVCASSSEGTPNPALEAAACGCVVVSTRVGNMPELIRPYVNGELVERDPQAMFDAIVRCQRKYVEMSIVMQFCIEARWSWQYHRAEQYFALFRKLIDAKSI